MNRTTSSLVVAGTVLLALAAPSTARAQADGVGLQPLPPRALRTRNGRVPMSARGAPDANARDAIDAPAPEPEPAPRPLKVLVTGFGPFGGVTFNPSWEAARRLDGATFEGATIVARQLPVVWDRAAVELAGHIREHAPDIVICTGVAEGEEGLRLERIARNENRGIADNDGVSISGEDIPGAAATYDSRLPLSEITAALEAAGIPSRYSEDAGGYLCNQTFFRVSHMSATGEVGPDARQRDRHGGRRRRTLEQQEPLPDGIRPATVGFIHVPGVKEDDDGWGSGLPMDEIARGVRIAVETTIGEVQRERAAEEPATEIAAADSETAPATDVATAEGASDAGADANAPEAPSADAPTADAATSDAPALGPLTIGGDLLSEAISRLLLETPRAPVEERAPADGFADVLLESGGE